MTSVLGDVIARAIEATAASGWQAEDAALRAELAEVDAAERMRRMRDAGVAAPRDVWRAIARDELDLTRTKALRAVVRWYRASDPPPTLVLAGDTGTGKSTAAAWWLAQAGGILERATAVATAWDSSTVSAQDRREAVCGVRCLVLDDVGTEPGRYREPMAEALREVVEARQSLRTIVTTNLTREQLSARYPDGRLDSRLSRVAWVVCDGEDLRRAT